MKSVYIVAAICLFIAVGETNALQCYKCDNCEKDAPTIQECSGSENECLKLHLGDYISKRCIREEMCNLEAIQKGWDSVRTKFMETFNMKDDKDKDDDKDAVSCCEGNLCNAGHSVQFTPTLSVIIGLGVFYHLYA